MSAVRARAGERTGDDANAAAVEEVNALHANALMQLEEGEQRPDFLSFLPEAIRPDPADPLGLNGHMPTVFAAFTTIGGADFCPCRAAEEAAAFRAMPGQLCLVTWTRKRPAAPLGVLGVAGKGHAFAAAAPSATAAICAASVSAVPGAQVTPGPFGGVPGATVILAAQARPPGPGRPHGPPVLPELATRCLPGDSRTPCRVPPQRAGHLVIRRTAPSWIGEGRQGHTGKRWLPLSTCIDKEIRSV